MGPGAIIFIVLGIFFLISALFIVKQQTRVVIERFGKFVSVRRPGLQMKVPFIDRKAGKITTRIQQLDVQIETKTKDDVFVILQVSVQFKVLEDKVYDAFYKLEDPHSQITSYVFDTVRAEVPKLKIDDVFERKDDVAIAVKRELQEAMIEYGYEIIKTLVTDIEPDVAVKQAMNRINAAEREKLAAEFEAEADRIRIVAKAQAEAESKKLQGQGIADQRREIARGLEESVEVLNKVGINSQEASSLIVITQHYDTLQAVGESTRSNLILLPNSPTGAADMLNDTIASFTSAKLMGDELSSQNSSEEK